MSDTLNTCPICDAKNYNTAFRCARCLWSFSSLMTLNAEQLEQKINIAKDKWEHRYENPEIVLDFKKDPFECFYEYTERLESQPWCIGEIVLIKDKYDGEKKIFPLKVTTCQDFANEWIGDSIELWLELDRHQAKALYEKSETWPIWGCFANRFLRAIVLFDGESELSVQTRDLRQQDQYKNDYLGESYRFLDNRDGTVTDRRNGLMWMQHCLGQEVLNGYVSGTPLELTWHEAMRQAKKPFAEHEDWRLPTIEELKSLVSSSASERQPFDYTGAGGQFSGEFQSPTIDTAAFPSTPEYWFWSATNYPNGDLGAWQVNFKNGAVFTNAKYYPAYVRLVRTCTPSRNS